MIKLVLSDVDGTLVPLGRHASPRTMRAIATLEEAGVRFGLSTGRDIVELMQIFDGDNRAMRTGVLSNGKKVFVDGGLVRLTLIDNGGLERMARVVGEFPGCFMTAYPLQTDATNPVYCLGAKPEDLVPWAERYAFNGTVVDKVPDEEIIGATIACPFGPEVMANVIARGTQACPEFDFVLPSPQWCDILPKGLNKGTALTMLLQELGIQRSEVVVFGDADNDLAILMAVDNSVAVANATRKAKTASRWHIGACEDEAVAQALEEIALATKEGRTPAFMCA